MTEELLESCKRDTRLSGMDPKRVPAVVELCTVYPLIAYPTPDTRKAR